MKFLLSLLLLTSNIALAELSPSQQLDATLSKIVAISEQFPGDANADSRRGAIKNLIDESFDFREMAKRALGAVWNEQSSDKQDQYVTLFSQLLSKNYIKKIEDVKPGMVRVLGEKLKNNKALVKSEVTYENETFPIDYKLYNKNSVWRVYDVAIENIGLISNYRNEFASIVRKDGFESLVNKLADKLQ